MKVRQALAGNIGNNRHGILLQIEAPGTKPRAKITHTTLLLDCSGSMSGVLDDVKGDAQRYVAELGPNDFVSVIIFSGENTARRIIGPTRCDETGRRMVNAAIKRDVQIMTTTVFSEPLQLVIGTVRPLAGEPAEHLCVLLTDGCAVPTRSSLQQEQTNAMIAAQAIANEGATLSVIGYGNWYDAEFLARLVAESGHTGVYKHVSDIADFGTAVREIAESAGRMNKAGIHLTFTTPNTGKVVRIIRTTPEVVGSAGHTFHTSALYEGAATLFIETSAPATALRVEGTVNGRQIKQDVTLSAMGNEGRATSMQILGAFAFLSGDRTLAQELFTQSGDDVVAERAGNAFSDREQRATGDMMRHAFTSGRRFFGAGLKPTGPNHNVLNVLRALIEDPGSVVYIPRGAYKRGGEAVSDPRVIEGGDRSLQVRDIISKDDRFNFSLRTLKDVKVLPVLADGVTIDDTGTPEAKQVWRSYNVIRDGNLVIEALEARLSQETFDLLSEAGVINATGGYKPNKVYAVNLRDLKLVSHAWAQPANLGLVTLLQNEAILEAKQTALNARLKALKIAGHTPAATGDDNDSNIYIERSKKVEGLVQETYTASLVEYRLMGFKANIGDLDVEKLDYAAADTMVRAVRKDLSITRFKIRAITFACEHAVTRNPIPWDAGKTVTRGKINKLEQTATFQGAKLKRVTGTEICVCS